MTPQQKQALTSAKINKVLELCKLLKLEITPKQQLDNNGYINNIILFMDMEKYPEDEAKEPAVEEAKIIETPADAQPTAV